MKYEFGCISIRSQTCFVCYKTMHLQHTSGALWVMYMVWRKTVQIAECSLEEYMKKVLLEKKNL